MRILALSGSLREHSTNRLLLEQLLRLAPEGVEIEVYQGLKSLPPYDADDEATAGTAVSALRERAKWADGLLIATPEYNGSVPGVLKNALDWLSRPFASNPLRGKPVLVVGASSGMFGAAWATDDLRRIMRTIGARPLDEGFTLPHSHEAFDNQGELKDLEGRAQLAQLFERLVEAITENQVQRAKAETPVAVETAG